MKVVVNTKIGGAGLSHDAVIRLISRGVDMDLMDNEVLEHYPLLFMERHNPELVRVVEEGNASGEMSHLVVMEIPDVDYFVMENEDGTEYIAEAHRTWEP